MEAGGLLWKEMGPVEAREPGRRAASTARRAAQLARSAAAAAAEVGRATSPSPGSSRRGRLVLRGGSQMAARSPARRPSRAGSAPTAAPRPVSARGVAVRSVQGGNGSTKWTARHCHTADSYRAACADAVVALEVRNVPLLRRDHRLPIGLGRRRRPGKPSGRSPGWRAHVREILDLPDEITWTPLVRCRAPAPLSAATFEPDSLAARSRKRPPPRPPRNSAAAEPPAQSPISPPVPCPRPRFFLRRRRHHHAEFAAISSPSRVPLL